MSSLTTTRVTTEPAKCRAVVYWIDWYAYHLARFKGLQSAFGEDGQVQGIEMVGGVGVHAGYAFREGRPVDLPIDTLVPNQGWHETSKIKISLLLVRRLSALDPDVVLIPGYYTLPGLAGALWCKAKGRLSILMTESTAYDHPRTGWREGLKAKLIRLLFDWAVTGGTAHDRYLLQLGFPKRRIAHFYDVVGNSQIEAAVQSIRDATTAEVHGLPDCFFLFVGRLSPEKNVDGLLRSWLSYRDAGGTWALVIAGDGPENDTLREAAASSAWEHAVHFLGHMSARELLPVYAFASVFVLPSTREPWGLVVNEAMAAKLPVLVSERCGCAEDLVRQGQNGFVFDPTDDVEMTRHLARFSSMPPEMLMQYGEQSQQRIAAYSPQNFGRQILRIADTVSERSSSGHANQSSNEIGEGVSLTNDLGVERRGGWLQVLSHIDPKYGGLSTVVPQLAQRLAEQENVRTKIAAFCGPDEAETVSAGQDLSYWPLGRREWLTNSSVREMFSSTVASVQGVHIHGLWESSTFFAASAARRAGIPYILSAHGMLERWAMQNKRLKKLVYSTLIERRNVQGAACLHALTAAEVEDYRRFGCRGPIAIIPNGVESPQTADPSNFMRRFPEAAGKRIILFLGRIHFKKGINLLIKSWSTLAAEFPDTLLVLAGPDSENTLDAAQKLVSELHVGDRVLFTGMLDAPLKWSALAASNFFVLPSYSEGLSVATLEALSLGIPVIISKECNLPEVEQAGAGWLVRTDIDDLTRVLRAALQSSSQERQKVSLCARTLAESLFGWPAVTAKTAQLYAWICGGPEPTNVEIVRGLA